MTIIYFIVALGILVFIHEFGHFIAAKKQGIGVEKFSLGFGPQLFKFTRGETTYMISALPFGGYVKLKGEDPDSEEADDPRSYSARPMWQKSLVVFAGPLMNLLLAFLFMPVVFMVGRMEPVFLDQKPVVIGVRHHSPAEKQGLKKGDEILEMNHQTFSTWQDFLDFVLVHPDTDIEMKIRRDDEVITKNGVIGKSTDTHAGTLGIEPTYFIGNEPMIDKVVPGSPAAEAGIQPGDEVVEINNLPVGTWTDMSEKVAENGGRAISVGVRRNQKRVTLSLTPHYDEAHDKWLMGVEKDLGKRAGAFVRKKYPFQEAVVKGTRENIKLSQMTLSVLGRLVTFKLSYKTLGGPIRIAQASAMAAKSGLSDFLYFLAFLSLQLGVLNLLPLPVLDGGHLFFFAIEAIQGRPLSAKVRLMAEQAGFVLLLTLMVLVTLNDVNSIWGVSQIFDKIRHLF